MTRIPNDSDPQGRDAAALPDVDVVWKYLFLSSLDEVGVKAEGETIGISSHSCHRPDRVAQYVY